MYFSNAILVEVSLKICKYAIPFLCFKPIRTTKRQPIWKVKWASAGLRKWSAEMAEWAGPADQPPSQFSSAAAAAAACPTVPQITSSPSPSGSIHPRKKNLAHRDPTSGGAAPRRRGPCSSKTPLSSVYRSPFPRHLPRRTDASLHAGSAGWLPPAARWIFLLAR
jgi:hypothetical protein